MSDFDPKAFLDETEQAKFDPKSFLAETGEPPSVAKPAPEGPGIGEAFARGAGQGATFGFGDEITGAVQAYDKSAGLNALTSPLAFAAHLTTGRPVKEFFENNQMPSGSFTERAAKLLGDYRANRDSERQQNQAAETAHKGTYIAGNVLGGVATSALGGGVPKTAWGAADLGAGLGAAQGIGSSNSDLTSGRLADYARAAEDGTIGGMAGGIGGALGYGAAKLLAKVAPYLQRSANSKAVESLGTRLPQYRALEYQEGVQPLGQDLLDKNIIPWRGGAENIQQRAAAEASRQGKTIGDTLEALDKSAASKGGVLGREPASLPAGGQPPAALTALNTKGRAMAQPGGDLFVRPSVVRSKAMEQVVNPIRGKPFVGKFAEPLADEIGAIQTPGDRMGIKETNDVLRLADQRIGDAYTHEGGVVGERLKQIRGILRGEQQAAAERIDPALAKTLAESKMSFGNMTRAAGIAEDRALRNLANRDLSPSDYAMGIGSALKGAAQGDSNVAKDTLLALAHKLVRERGNAFTARALQAGSGFAGGAGRDLASAGSRYDWDLIRRALQGENQGQ